MLGSPYIVRRSGAGSTVVDSSDGLQSLLATTRTPVRGATDVPIPSGSDDGGLDEVGLTDRPVRAGHGAR